MAMITMGQYQVDKESILINIVRALAAYVAMIATVNNFRIVEICITYLQVAQCRTYK